MKAQLTQQQAVRYSRHIMLPGFDLENQELLMEKRVLLIGVGGLGCAAAQYLVSSGVGQLILVDDDIVDLSNLQRQTLFTESDVEQKKCLAAQQRLAAMNSETKLTPITHRLSNQELRDTLRNVDIVIDCTDNLPTREQINAACLVGKVPLVSGAAIRMEGQLFCMIPAQQTACYRCLSHYFGEQTLSCNEAGVMSPLVGVIGAMQALEAIKIVLNFGEPGINQLLVFDGMTMQWRQFSVPKRTDCTACSQ